MIIGDVFNLRLQDGREIFDIFLGSIQEGRLMRNPVTSYNLVLMCRPLAFALLVAFGLTVTHTAVWAQSGVGSSNEITTGEAADRLLQPGQTAPDLSKNAIDQGAAPATGTKSNPTQAEKTEAPPPAGIVKIRNCGTTAVRVKSYNPADIVYAVPHTNIRIEPNRWGGVSCAADRCKVQINNGRVSSAVRGERVIKDGRLATGSC
jgi:hypothetical protein